MSFGIWSESVWIMSDMQVVGPDNPRDLAAFPGYDVTVMAGSMPMQSCAFQKQAGIIRNEMKYLVF